MKNDRYYYSRLTAQDKEIYKQLYIQMTAHKETVTVKTSVGYKADAEAIFKGLECDNPELYFVNLKNVKYTGGTNSITFFISYYLPQDNVETINTAIEKKLQHILSKVHGNNLPDIVFSAHDVLVRNVLYDEQALDNLQGMLLRSNTILGVLFYKTAVCEGIAKTFKLLLNRLDIQCIVVTGKAKDTALTPNEDDVFHAWNIVRVNDRNYAVDVTWDINLSSEKIIRHDYLCLSDALMSKDHTQIGTYPGCTWNDDDYLSQNGLNICKIPDIEKVIAEKIKSGIDAVEFRYSGREKLTDEMVKNTVFKVVSERNAWHKPVGREKLTVERVKNFLIEAMAKDRSNRKQCTLEMNYNASQNIYGLSWQ